MKRRVNYQDIKSKEDVLYILEELHIMSKHFGYPLMTKFSHEIYSVHKLKDLFPSLVGDYLFSLEKEWGDFFFDTLKSRIFERKPAGEKRKDYYFEMVIKSPIDGKEMVLESEILLSEFTGSSKEDIFLKSCAEDTLDEILETVRDTFTDVANLCLEEIESLMESYSEKINEENNNLYFFDVTKLKRQCLTTEYQSVEELLNHSYSIIDFFKERYSVELDPNYLYSIPEGFNEISVHYEAYGNFKEDEGDNLHLFLEKNKDKYSIYKHCLNGFDSTLSISFFNEVPAIRYIEMLNEMKPLNDLRDKNFIEYYQSSIKPSSWEIEFNTSVEVNRLADILKIQDIMENGALFAEEDTRCHIFEDEMSN